MLDAQVEQIELGTVVHVISDAGPHPYFRTLIEAGGLEGGRLIVGSVGPAGALQRDMEAIGVETFALGAPSRLRYPAAVVRLARLLRRHRAQVVQTHLLDGCLVGLAAARLARTPIAIMTAHHSHELPFHGRRLVWPERVCAGPLSDHIIAPSRAVAQALTRWAGARPGKIDVVHHGFDLERLDPDRVDGGPVRHELGVDGKIAFGAIGRVYELKNYPALLEAFAAIPDATDELRLVIVGPGELEPLRARARSLGIESKVVLRGYRGDVPELLAAFDVFVHPAIAESFGMVIVEAMAMARPVVSARVGVAPEVIEPGVTGFLSAAPDAKALAAALREALERRPEWRHVGAAARLRVSGFTARAMAERYEELYVLWLRESEHGRVPRSERAAGMPMKASVPAARRDADETPPVA